MNRQDWLEYFEAVNGRPATEDEVTSALTNGEFVETPIKEEVNQQGPSSAVASERDIISSETTQANQNSQSFTASANPKSGQDQGPSSQPHPQFMSQQTYDQMNMRQEQLKETTRDFWTWFQSALSSPSSDAEINSKNGWLAFGLLTLFYSLTAFVVLRNMVYGFDFSSSYYSPNPIGFSAFIALFLAAALYMFAFIFSGYVAKRFVYKESVSLGQTMDWYSRLLSSNILLMGIATLFALIQVYSVVIVLSIISVVIFSFAMTFALANGRDVSPMDRFYKYMIACFVNSLVFFLISLLSMLIAGEYLTRLSF